MPRFTWDRERPERLLKDRAAKTKPGAFTIKERERGARELPLKSRASISTQRRKVTVTLAGRYGTDTHES